MYNLAKSAEAGFRGTVAEALDFLLVSNISNRKTAASERAPEPATHAPGG